jgi:hypothetical protein
VEAGTAETSDEDCSGWLRASASRERDESFSKHVRAEAGASSLDNSCGSGTFGVTAKAENDRHSTAIST